MRIGFIGTGAICEALITGLIEHGNFNDEVRVSLRSEARSTKLAAKFCNVTVHEENQRIVDQSDWVFIGVLPDQAQEVIQGLHFEERQTLISLVAGISVDEIKPWVAPLKKVHRIIPLPPVELGVGPLPIYPASKELADFVNRCGTAIEIEDESHFSTLSAASAVMATHHRFVATLADWIVAQGLPEEVASVYASQMINGLSKLECSSNYNELRGLADECLTAGGLNEQVLLELEELEWFDHLSNRLDRISARLQR